MRLASTFPVCLMCAAASLLAGCSLTSTAPSSAPVAETGPALHGIVHGGQQPIVGAHVYMYAAGTGGYGGNGIAASSANASQSLLNSSVLTNNPGNSGMDGSGNYYVTTDSVGNFVLTNDYSCSAGQQIYIYTVGGNPGSGTNAAASLLAALGDCSTISSSTMVFADEVSTVATAYAVAGFATDATHISSSGTALAKTGIYNAFANVTNLETLSTGTALATTPGGNGTVPQSTINTIADILAACINSTGPTSTGCTTLFNNIKSSGATGTSATDTATAAIYLAHWPYPGASQLTALYGSPTPTTPFTPTLGSKPNDFTLSIIFNDGNGTGTRPNSIAIDASGNAWIVNAYQQAATLSKLSPLGVPATGSPFSGNGLSSSGVPIGGLAIDPSNNVWITSNGVNGLSEFTNSGAAATNSPFIYSNSAATLGGPIAIDGSGNIWSPGPAGTSVLSEISNSGSVLSPTGSTTGYALGTGAHAGQSIAISAGGTDILVAGYNPNAQTTNIYDFKTSSKTFGTPWYYGGGASEGQASLAYDSFGSVWDANYGGNIARFTTGNPGTYDYSAGTSGGTNTVAIDGAGTIWGCFQGTPSNGTSGIEELASPGTGTSAPVSMSPSSGYYADSTDLIIAQSTPDIALDGSGDLWYVGEFYNVNSNSYADDSYGVIEFIGIAAPAITPLSAATASSSTGPGTRP